MRQLELAVGGQYDVITSSGMTFAGLRFGESLSVSGKLCLLFVTPDGRVITFNLSYIAVITEAEGGLTSEPVPRQREGSIRPGCESVRSNRPGDVPGTDRSDEQQGTGHQVRQSEDIEPAMSGNNG